MFSKFISLGMSGLPVCFCVHHVHVVLTKARRGHQTPGIGASKPLCGSWEPNRSSAKTASTPSHLFSLFTLLLVLLLSPPPFSYEVCVAQVLWGVGPALESTYKDHIFKKSRFFLPLAVRKYQRLFRSQWDCLSITLAPWWGFSSIFSLHTSCA